MHPMRLHQSRKCLVTPPVLSSISHLCVLPPPPEDDKVEVVSQQQDEAPAEPRRYPEEVAFEQPGDSPLEQTDYLTEPQALGELQAHTPEVLNGGSEHSQSQTGVCACVWGLGGGFGVCLHTVPVCVLNFLLYESVLK